MLVFVESIPFKATFDGVTSNDMLKQIADARTFSVERLSAYKQAVGTGNDEIQAQLQSVLLGHPKARIRSVIAAAKKMSERSRPTLNQCMVIADKINVIEPCDELVKVTPKAKKPNGFRTLADFGIVHRTRQDLVARVMGPHFVPRTFQYGHQGVQQAIKSAKAFLAEGFVYTAKLDICDFFGSFELDKLAPELPLPQGAVENAVVGRHMKMSVAANGKGYHTHSLIKHDIPNLLSQARRGIPTGSASSPIIAAFMLSRLSWHPKAKAKLVNFVDDFLLLATSLRQLEEEVGKLTDAVTNLSGGHFKLKLVKTYMAQQGIEFLGHRLQLANGTVVTLAGVTGYSGIVNVLVEIEGLGSASWKPEARLKRLAKMLAYAVGWRKAFCECDDVDDHYNDCLIEIEKTAASFGLTLAQIEHAAERSMTYKPDGYTLGKDADF